MMMLDHIYNIINTRNEDMCASIGDELIDVPAADNQGAGNAIYRIPLSDVKPIALEIDLTSGACNSAKRSIGSLLSQIKFSTSPQNSDGTAKTTSTVMDRNRDVISEDTIQIPTSSYSTNDRINVVTVIGDIDNGTLIVDIQS